MKRMLLALLLAVALAGVYGFAASLRITGVDKLGAGTAKVEAPANVSVTDVSWADTDNNYATVEQVVVELQNCNPTLGEAATAKTVDVYVTLYDGSGSVLGYGSATSVSLSAETETDTTQTPGTGTATITLNTNVDAERIASTAITVIEEA